MRDFVATIIIFGTIIGGAVFLKNWQCKEMFPEANRIACILWK